MKKILIKFHCIDPLYLHTATIIAFCHCVFCCMLHGKIGGTRNIKFQPCYIEHVIQTVSPSALLLNVFIVFQREDRLTVIINLNNKTKKGIKQSMLWKDNTVASGV